jgi:hypothetical protein
VNDVDNVKTESKVVKKEEQPTTKQSKESPGIVVKTES